MKETSIPSPHKQFSGLARVLFAGTMLVFFAGATAACMPNTAQQNNADTETEQTEKSGFTTLSGTLSQQTNSYLLQTSTGPVVVQSLEVDLSSYIGETVTVTGKYSGDELFVSEISTE